MRTLKEKHLAQDQNSEVALWIFRQKKSFGSYYEELVLSAVSHTCMHILTTPLQSPCLPVVQALHSGIRALSLPSCVTETTVLIMTCFSLSSVFLSAASLFNQSYYLQSSYLPLCACTTNTLALRSKTPPR